MKWLPGRILPPFPLIVPAIVSGALLTLCFPVASLGPVSFVALAPMFVAMLRHRPGRRDAFRAGFLMGAVCFLGMMWWIVKLSPAADVSIPLLSRIIPASLAMPLLLTPALVLLVLYLALYPATHLLLLAMLTRWRPSAFVIAAPPLWAALEIVRSRGMLAFPWGLAGYTLSDHPVLLQTAELWGVFGLSFIIVLINALVAGVVVTSRPRAKIGSGLLAGVIVANLLLYGNAAIDRVHAVTASSLQGTPIRVAIAQPNIDLAIKWNPAYKDSTFNQVDRQSLFAREHGADLVVFPETCAPIYIENAPPYRQRLQDLATALEMPVFIGFLDHRYDGPGRALNIYNSSGVFLPDGSLEKYDKRHLLPFGEELPLATRFRWLRKINFGQANFQPGPSRAPLPAGNARFTPLICFESVFPELCRDGVREGTEFFVNVTNDGWFGDTPGPYQHAQMSIARAVEFRRFLVRSANSGVSMVVAPTGEVTDTLGLYREGVLLADVARVYKRTFYFKYGDGPLLLASFALLVLAGVLARRVST